MMDLKQFAEVVKDEAAKRLGTEYEVDIAERLKSNGVVMTQLCIRKKDCQVCPSIYLENFFEEYREGKELQAVTDNILSYYGSIPDMSDRAKEVTKDLNYEILKRKTICKLINTRENQTLLEAVPSIPYLDMSIVFFIYSDMVKGIRTTAIVDNRIMEKWGITVDELYQTALANMRKDFPPYLADIDVLVSENTTENLLDGESVFEPGDYGYGLFVLSNRENFYGAAVLLYPGLMKQCKEKLGTDFYILPSSVDEVILAPLPDGKEGFLDAYELSHIIQTVNEELISIEERLSNHAYRYCSADDQVISA